jgi:hypothetical protein
MDEDKGWRQAKTMTSKYPWHDWLDGRVWFVRTNVDFRCLELSVQSMAHGWARTLGVSVSTRLVASEGMEGVLMQAYPTDSTWKPNLAKISLTKVRNKATLNNPR